MAPIAAIQCARFAQSANEEQPPPSQQAVEPTAQAIGMISTTSSLTTLVPSGGIHPLAKESAHHDIAASKSEGLPKELLEIVGGVAGAVSFVTTTFSLGAATPAAPLLGLGAAATLGLGAAATTFSLGLGVVAATSSLGLGGASSLLTDLLGGL